GQGPWRGAIGRRLNRVEYTNAIRDLLAVEVDGASLLPVDDSGYGFDNIAEILSVTPALLDRYLVAAQKISRQAVGDPAIHLTRSLYSVSSFVVQHDRVSDELPFLSRGGSAIRHDFPLDGEYGLRVRLRKLFVSGNINGIDKREQIDVRVDGARIAILGVGGECVGSTEPRCTKTTRAGLQVSEYEHDADAPLYVRFAARAGVRVVG